MDEGLLAAIAHYHGLIESDLGAADAQLDLLLELQHRHGALFGGRPLATSLRPALTSEALYRSVHEAAFLLRQSLDRIAQAFFSDPAVLDELGLTPFERELIALPTPALQYSATSRCDAFLTADSFQFVEVNGETPAGQVYCDRIARLYREIPIFARFTESHPVRFVSPAEHLVAGLLRVYHEEFDGREARPAFAVIDHLDVPTTYEFELFRQYVGELGMPCEVLDARALEVRDGWIYANGRRIDIVYRRLLMNELEPIKDGCRALLTGYAAGKTCVLNTFRSKLVHKKAIFALLTDPAYTRVLTDAERSALAKHVPWTRKLRDRRTEHDGRPVDLLEHVRRNKDRFVIKPNDEYGGKGVVLGFAASDAEWATAIDTCAGGDFVVQEVVKIHREPFLLRDGGSWTMTQNVVDLDPYLNGPLVGGCLVRISSTNLANVTAGGGSLPQFIVRSR